MSLLKHKYTPEPVNPLLPVLMKAYDRGVFDEHYEDTEEVKADKAEARSLIKEMDIKEGV